LTSAVGKPTSTGPNGQPNVGTKRGMRCRKKNSKKRQTLDKGRECGGEGSRKNRQLNSEKKSERGRYPPVKC